MISSLLKPGNFVVISSLTTTSQYCLYPELDQIIVESIDDPGECQLISLTKQPLMMFIETQQIENAPGSILGQQSRILILINNKLFYIYDEKALYFKKLDLE